MFPLKQRKLIRGCDAHIKAGLGCGADYVASIGTPLYASFEGTIETYYGKQGGNWTRLTRTNGDKIEMAHLQQYVVKSGKVLPGVLIAYTGNTGEITTGPHLHIQIFRDGKRIDPNAYNWEDVIINPMNCDNEKAEIQKLNTEIGRVTQERDTFRTENKELKSQLKEEISTKIYYYNEWQKNLDKANGLQDKLTKCTQGEMGKLQAILNIIMN